MIVSDFDGTLKNSKNCISERTVQNINKFVSLGGQFLIATARPIFGLKSYIKNIQHTAYYLLCNGALILDDDYKTVFEQYIDIEALHFLIDFFWNDPDIYFILIGKNFSWTNQFMLTPPFSEYQKILKSKKIDKSSLLKESLQILNIEIHSTTDKLKKIEKAIIDNHITSIVSQFSWSNFMEVYSSQISKGLSLQHIQQKTGISKSHTLAFGDGNNDISLFEQSGIAVAMGNATDKLKQYADFITGNYDADGVAVFIEKNIL